MAGLEFCEEDYVDMPSSSAAQQIYASVDDDDSEVGLSKIKRRRLQVRKDFWKYRGFFRFLHPVWVYNNGQYVWEWRWYRLASLFPSGLLRSGWYFLCFGRWTIFFLLKSDVSADLNQSDMNARVLSILNGLNNDFLFHRSQHICISTRSGVLQRRQLSQTPPIPKI